ncbi:LysR substrate-binding domain-containing protein [Nitratireductor sp. XY-223]|uniref:LysR substrate-binding domain-containing protein n=1 Tax=Nitratireductor sp. XY-223 TaxID=2561926 RepID=UPI0010AB3ED6|nr:LysR substrate-binding domain-containing protein [Nitratireductor sp. XY-223]
MAAPLDIDQLKTFIAIVDMGSFTRAAEEVNKTQSAVSMQMRRLEERVGKVLFEKDGRINRLTGDGERLLAYARRLVRLNNETLAAFDEEALAGTIRLGTPDDYADRYMPDIIARFAKTNPHVELTITCEPSKDLIEKLNRNELDIALVTHNPKVRNSIMVRSEPLLWVTSMAHSAHSETPVPLAVGRRDCDWRQLGCAALDSVGREYGILFTSWSSTVVASAVLAGLAVSLLPESALRPGMRILTPADGFPALPPAEIGMIRRPGVPTVLMDAITDHIAASLDNMTPPEDGSDPRSPNRKGRNRQKGHLMMSSW